MLGLKSVDLEGAGIGTHDVADIRIDLDAGLREVDGEVRATLVAAPAADATWP